MSASTEWRKTEKGRLRDLLNERCRARAVQEVVRRHYAEYRALVREYRLETGTEGLRRLQHVPESVGRYEEH